MQIRFLHMCIECESESISDDRCKRCKAQSSVDGARLSKPTSQTMVLKDQMSLAKDPADPPEGLKTSGAIQGTVPRTARGMVSGLLTDLPSPKSAIFAWPPSVSRILLDFKS